MPVSAGSVKRGAGLITVGEGSEGPAAPSHGTAKPETAAIRQTSVRQSPAAKSKPSGGWLDNFTQQKLRAYQPILTAKWIIIIFMTMGFVLSAIGGFPFYLVGLVV